MGYQFIRMADGPLAASTTVKKRLRSFIAKLIGYQANLHSNMELPLGTAGSIYKYTWCQFFDLIGQKKFDFKVTSRDLRSGTNTRNSSMISWVEPRTNRPYLVSDSDDEDVQSRTEHGGWAGYNTYYGEVQYFFTAELPSELSLPEDIVIDDGDGTGAGGADGAGIIVQALAMVRRFRVEKLEVDRDFGLTRKVRGSGAGGLVVVHVKWIRELVGLMKVDKDEYLIK